MSDRSSSSAMELNGFSDAVFFISTTVSNIIQCSVKLTTSDLRSEYVSGATIRSASYCQRSNRVSYAVIYVTYTYNGVRKSHCVSYKTQIYTPHFKLECCAIATMTTRCANKSKQTATPPPKITWLSFDSIQPDVMDVGVERTFSPQNFSMFAGE